VDGAEATGESQAWQRTRIVATLDAQIRKDENAIWCASFLAARKTLEADVVGEAPSLQGDPPLALALSKAADPRSCIPEASLYAAAGRSDKGIIDQIRGGLAQKFPAKTPPTFPGIRPDSLVAYAYLEANLKFAIPYFQNRKPLVFTDGAGRKTELSSFGIRPEDDYAYFQLRRQPAILCAFWDTTDHVLHLAECVVDLDRTSQPNQILVAWMTPKPTLAEMLETLDALIKQGERDEDRKGLGPNDVLLVPDMVWRMTHRFMELEGRPFTNAKLKGQRMDVAQQDIYFRLDRGGAELKSEAKFYALPIPSHYVFDRPFIVVMKKRGAEMPYFVMWVANADLLTKWP